MEMPVPPKDLQPPGRRLWAAVLEIGDPTGPELIVLEEACRAADYLAVLHAVVRAEGELVQAKDRRAEQQWKSHAALVEIRALEVTFTRLMASLKLPDSQGYTPGHRQARGAYLRKAGRLRGVS